MSGTRSQKVAPVEKPVQKSNLYAIRLGLNAYKVGHSRSQEKRVKSGQTFFTQPLLTVCCVPVANPLEAEKRCLHLLGSRGRQAGHEVVEKSEEEVIRAIHLVTGHKVLTPHQVGLRLWATEFEGRTIGSWATAAWADGEKSMLEAVRSPSRLLLNRLGLEAIDLEYKYLHFYDVRKLIKVLPEMGLWAGMISEWDGLLEGGTPIQPDKKRTAVKLSVVKS